MLATIKNHNVISGFARTDEKLESFLYSSLSDYYLMDIMSVHSIDLHHKTKLELKDIYYRYMITTGKDSADLVIYIQSRNLNIQKAAPIIINVPSDISYNIVLDGCFEHHHELIDITALAELDASKVISMRNMFNCCNNLTDITPISRWDVSNVMDMRGLFYECLSLKNILALSDWTVPENCNIRKFYTIPEVPLEELYRYIYPEVDDIKAFIENDEIESASQTVWMEHTVPYRRMKYQNAYVQNNCPNWLVERFMKVHVFRGRWMNYDYECNEYEYRNELGEWQFENYRDIIDYETYNWYDY